MRSALQCYRVPSSSSHTSRIQTARMFRRQCKQGGFIRQFWLVLLTAAISLAFSSTLPFTPVSASKFELNSPRFGRKPLHQRSLHQLSVSTASSACLHTVEGRTLIADDQGLEDVELKMEIGKPGQSCDDTCAERGLKCQADLLHRINNCPLLRHFFPCTPGCFASMGAEQPAEVVEAPLGESA
ncbi:unnamed protein product [Closterium sp. Yama58-4]|nr:unnamed protein product [Closterium sp. Yama58-4]